MDLTPKVLFGENYAFSSPDISIDNTDNASISDAEANELSGDYRRVLYGLLADIYTRYNKLAPQEKPAKMTFAKNSSFNDNTGTGNITFTIRFTVGEYEAEVVDED